MRASLRRLCGLGLVGLLAGCGGKELDEDGDGYAASQDCDDKDAAIHPAATEACDGLDNDCDDLVDDDDPSLAAASARPFYGDGDGDGYGASEDVVLACLAPLGRVEQGGDCQDGDAAIHPGAEERCDGIDNDCSGRADDGSVDATAWFADQDGDGYGQDGGEVLACTAPEAHVALGGDCQDEDAEVHPGAVEVCNDGVDNDCDEGEGSGCRQDLGSAWLSLLGEGASDDAGVSFARLGDLDGDGREDLAVGARNHDGGGADAGAVYLLYGALAAGARSLGMAEARLLGAAEGDKAGRVVGAGDLDGDGWPDLVVGAPNADEGGNASGSVLLLFHPGRLVGDVPLGGADLRIVGEATFDYLGVGLAIADMDGDGQLDLLLGASGSDRGRDNAGAVYLLAGPLASGVVDLEETTPTARVTGVGNADGVGLDLAAGEDLDGDGLVELLIGASANDSGGTDAGAVWLMLGPHGGSLSLADADGRLLGPASGSGFGSAVGIGGDVDGDGRPEVLVGASRQDEAGGADVGAVFVLPAVSFLDSGAVLDLALGRIEGEAADDQLGADLDGRGDHDGDGVLDVLVGATNAGGDGSGRAWLFRGPVEGVLGPGDAAVELAGATGNDHVGSVVRFLGDLGGEGVDAIGVSGLYVDVGDAADAGAVYLHLVSGR